MKRIRYIFLLFFLVNLLHADNNATNNKVLQDNVEISIGQEWSNEQRKKKENFNKLCPYNDKTEKKDSNSKFLISNIDLENNKIGCVEQKITFDDENLNVFTGNTQQSPGNEVTFNIADIDDMAYSSTDLKNNSKYSKKLEAIITNARGDNEKIYPLVFKNIRGLIDGSPMQNGENVSRPFIGFLGIGNKVEKLENSNMLMQLFGVNPYYENKDGFNLVSAVNNQTPKELGKDKKIKQEKEVVSWGDIGYSIGTWTDNLVTTSSSDLTVDKIKTFFSGDKWKSDDSSQTWSRVMTGVAVLDDSYIGNISGDGELIIRDGIAKDPINARKNNSLISIDSSSFRDIFHQTSDGKLWGFYVYLTQNLHALEVYLILTIAGVGFGGLMVANGATWFSVWRNGEQNRVNWKQAIFIPFSGLMCIAVPIVPTSTQLFSSFILDTEKLGSEIQVEAVNVRVPNEYNDSTFYQTGLQYLIQSLATMGAPIADKFSQKTTFSFATYISFRQNAMYDPSAMLQGWKKSYNETSADLIELNRLFTFYLSTCKNDYSVQASEKEIKNSAITLPTQTNLYNDNVTAKYGKKAFDSNKENYLNKYGEKFYQIAYPSPQLCAQIETELYKKSEPLVADMFRLSNEIKATSNSIILSGDNKKTHNELEKKIRRLAFYENNYGWVNTAMLPIMHQILFPSFNPYKQQKNIDKLSGDDNSQNSNNMANDIRTLLSKEYFVIGSPTTSDGKSNRLKSNDINPNDKITAVDTSDTATSGGFVNFFLSLITYNFLPGYDKIEGQIKELYTALGDDSGKKYANGESVKNPKASSYAFAMILGALTDDWGSESGANDNLLNVSSQLQWAGIIGGSKLGSNLLQNMANKLSSKFGNIGANFNALADMVVIKLASQIVYLYTLNLIVMIVISLVLVYKISMYFLQLIIFYMASPLVVIWSLMQRKQEHLINYAGKASVLFLTPVLIVLSSAILLLGVGVIHEIWAMIANHAMNIQLVNFISGIDPSEYSSSDDTNAFIEQIGGLKDFIQMQVLIGIGNVLVGFSYLFLGYVVIIKFSNWFFDTIGIQANNAISHSLDSIGQRMTFGRQFMS